MREKSKMPPPGTYNVDDTSTKNKSPSISFGGKLKAQNLTGDGIPGPGQYQLKSTLEGRGGYLAGKNIENIKERAPGPGQYDNLSYKSGPAFTIGGIKGDQSHPNKDFPGPGTYGSPERPNSTGGSYRFGNEERKGLGNKSDMPGPGQYTIPNNVGNEGKNITMSGRYETKLDTNKLGPGQYQFSQKASGPMYSMGAGEKGTKLNKDAINNPPPGAYSVDANTGKHKSAGIVFGKGLRDETKDSRYPGPGNYPLGSTLANKGITIQGKYEENIKERAPGPGTYENKGNPRTTHGGNIKFGSGARSSPVRNSCAPGPGQYSLEFPHGKGVSMGKDLRDRPQKSDIPGPGQYNTRAEEGLTYF
jgi:hypothetical protein